MISIACLQENVSITIVDPEMKNSTENILEEPQSQNIAYQ